MSDGFLARWSRRKRDEARRPAAPPAAAPDAAPSVEAAAAAPVEDEGALSPEELARLPSLDALTAATDLAPFLRAGVPRALRNAALRRMWSVDPAIRDFVSEAREYAYDWNTPGGVPGTGGLIPAEDVRAMVERVFGGGGEEKDAPAEADRDEAGIGRLPPPVEPARIPVTPEEQPVLDPCPLSSSLWTADGAGGTAEPHARPLPPPVPPQTLDRSRAVPGPAGDDRSFAVMRPSQTGEEPSRNSLDHREKAPGSPAPPRLRRHGGALPI
ncbi:DUF3306 domain-containing protein [Methylobacterium frigidaeris]|uniref:DUF3306 domain-containing protein n=1 Tax=Methylobacterium frigidaeris TaxID=2038277 RepID=A0AA37HBZ1_9HYPH|nr:DUF3306 domain-containing protein [Methylobacterium frigidaeris]GJD62878.1 hypothetical protein MPEAHAMD_3037 [Methylobacterium frigidaeris]